MKQLCSSVREAVILKNGGLHRDGECGDGETFTFPQSGRSCKCVEWVYGWHTLVMNVE